MCDRSKCRRKKGTGRCKRKKIKGKCPDDMRASKETNLQENDKEPLKTDDHLIVVSNGQTMEA